MKRRKDYCKFKEILEKYQITKFYHFTDRSNLESIMRNGGLYSWGDCIKRGIIIEHPGGSDLSHSLDRQENLQDYVRTSICKRHPMMYNAMNDGRIKNPVILEIDTDILYQEGNIFSNKNAVRSDASKGSDFSNFQTIHFETALRNTQFDIEDAEKDYFQAEILIKNHIPLHYILNISDFIESNDSKGKVYVRPPYSAQITSANPTAIFFVLNQSYQTDEEVFYNGEQKHVSQIQCDILNKHLNNIITQNTKEGIIHNKYHISVVGYGDYAYNCLEGNLKNKDFVKLTDLKENPISIRKTINKKKTRKGFVQFESEEPIWIKPRSNYNAYFHKALERVKGLVEKWISLHPDSFPPIVIHISGFGYNGIEDCDIIPLANEIKSLYTKDGNVIFANLIFSAVPKEKPIILPNSIREMGESVFGEMYFLMSSQLPLSFNLQFQDLRNNMDGESFHKAFAFKTTIRGIPKFLQSLIPLK